MARILTALINKNKNTMSKLLISLTYFIMSSMLLSAQDLPEVIPPSPSVAALMRYSDIPVSNYTGTPNISIPLYSTKTRSKDIGLDIVLRYHTAGITADQQASDVGLGWSLFAGGTISRTVKDIPDEYYLAPINGPVATRGKIGIYHNQQPYHRNDFYRLLENFNGTINITQDEKDRFLWEDFTGGKFDTDHDIWNYQFMGHNGKFIIQKNYNSGLLEVKNLSLDNTLKIINHYDGSNYQPIAFTVYDDKGYRYIFDIKEQTVHHNSQDNDYYTLGLTFNTGSAVEYDSAFHLSAIYDNNGNALVTFTYGLTDTYEVSQSTSYEYNVPLNDTGAGSFSAAINFIVANDLQNQAARLEPKSSFSYGKTVVKTKKIDEIDVKGHAKYTFSYDNSRLDFSETDKQSVKLIAIVEKDYNDAIISQWQFDYFYNTLNYRHKNKLFLNAVTKKGTGSLEESTLFNYNFAVDPNKRIGIDHWGYHKALNSFESLELDRGPTIENSTLGLLTKITYPTGGSTVFYYEPNTYSYIGNEVQTNFDDNPMNWEDEFTQVFFNSLNQQQTLFTLSEAQDVRIAYNIGNVVSSDYRLIVYKLEGGTYQQHTTIELSHFNANGIHDLEKSFDAGTYKVSLSSVDLDFPRTFNIDVRFFYKSRAAVQHQFLLGGGNRIKQIDYYTTQGNRPEHLAKSVSYDYSKTDAPDVSSGSLAFGKPVLEYNKNRLVELVIIMTGGDLSRVYSIDYRTITGSNQIHNFRTHGSDIGYKNVTVSQTGNGKSVYEYTSPIDFPEPISSFNNTATGHFHPTPNFDYKRGLLLSETLFSTTQKIQQTDYTYTFEEAHTRDRVSGFKIDLATNNCPYNYRAGTYDFFEELVYLNPLPSITSSLCPRPHLNYFLNPIQHAYGWSKLTNKVTKVYNSGENGTPAQALSYEETFTYNPINKKTRTHLTVNPDGDTVKTEYTYDTNNSVHSQNRISELKTTVSKRNGKVISTATTDFNNTWSVNDAYLPKDVKTLKGTQGLSNPMEERLTFHDYDAYGNPLEVSKANGTRIMYVWGYNDTRPIAKIENASYQSLPTNIKNLIAQIKAVSNTESTETEENSLRQLLDQLRNHPYFTSAMVTSYTYDPLIGTTSATDARGHTTYYQYDSFNRLKLVKDRDGNILNKNDYHHKTQH